MVCTFDLAPIQLSTLHELIVHVGLASCYFVLFQGIVMLHFNYIALCLLDKHLTEFLDDTSGGQEGC
jgi:hypothetical protein